MNLHPKLITSTAKAEIISIELTLPNKKRLTVSTLYRVGTLGNFNAKEVATHFTKIFNSKKYKYNFIVGDMNLDTVNWLSNSTSNRVHTSLINLFDDLGLSQLIHEATHKGGKILEVLLCDSPDFIRNLKVEIPGTFVSSDHSPISFSINAFARKVKAAKHSIYNFKKANWAQLNNDLSRVDWLHLLGSNEVEMGWNIFKNKFLAICDKRIPKIKISESFHLPWFDSDVFRLNKKKELCRKQFKQTNDQRHYKKYSSLRKQLKSLIKSKMRANFDDELNPNVITKKFWSSVRSTSKSSRIPEKMHLGNTVRNKSEKIANLFNKHFYNQFSDSSTYEIDIDFSNDLFSDFSIDDRIICNALRELNPSKSKGPENIGGLLLKNCAQSISYPLSILFNISFRTGSLPTEWKMANIVPVYKKGDKNCIENYRPISLTCMVSKIFEKCIRDELLSHCKELIHDTQHGFIPNKSCFTQLLPFSHDISLGLNSGELIDVVYFDFAKAFDSVNHDTILHKLKYQFGIDGHMLKFIKEYLKGRKQRVLVNGKFSTILDVKSGVPQGSILGPLLFVLFINDIHTKISENTQIMLYADDTKIWRHILAPIDNEILQRDIDSLNAWATLNKIKFHPEKCKILFINDFNYNILQELPFYLYPYELDNTVLDYVNEEKDLGVLMTSKFTYKAHQEYIIKKATV